MNNFQRTTLQGFSLECEINQALLALIRLLRVCLERYTLTLEEHSIKKWVMSTDNEECKMINVYTILEQHISKKNKSTKWRFAINRYLPI